jgi:hypothetical protein
MAGQHRNDDPPHVVAKDGQHWVTRREALARTNANVADDARVRRFQRLLFETTLRELALGAKRGHCGARGLVGGVAEELDHLQIELTIEPLELGGSIGQRAH